jgi:hypothetical protein
VPHNRLGDPLYIKHVEAVCAKCGLTKAEIPLGWCWEDFYADEEG